VDCGRDRIDGCAFEVLEKVESRLFRYEFALSVLALEGGEVTRAGNVVVVRVAEAGSLRV
jgi:hypothetical protein